MLFFFFFVLNKIDGERELFALKSFDPNPFVRHTFWTLTIGGALASMTVYGSNQATIQRYFTVKTVKEARMYIFIFI